MQLRPRTSHPLRPSDVQRYEDVTRGRQPPTPFGGTGPAGFVRAKPSSESSYAERSVGSVSPTDEFLQRTGSGLAQSKRGSLSASINEPRRAGHRARPLSSRSLGGMSQHSCRIEEWSGAPRMDAGAPSPAIHAADGTLVVAYRVAEPAAGAFQEGFALVQFTGVLQHTFGYPNDEALAGHPLFGAGLSLYAFNEVVRSPYVVELGARNAKSFPDSEPRFTQLRHWIVTFHDETLEVVGTSIGYLESVSSSSAREALREHAAHQVA